MAGEGDRGNCPGQTPVHAFRNTRAQAPPAGPRPPVVAFQLGRELRLDGRRLGLLGSTALHVECACGHSGRVSVEGLVSRHGSEARVRDAVASMRCRHCHESRIKQVRWLG